MATQFASIVCLYYPSQLIPALAAVRTYRQAKEQPQDDPVMVVVWCAPSVDAAARELRRQTFQTLLAAIPGTFLVFFSREETAGVLSSSRRVEDKVKYFREQHLHMPVRDVFFSHDISADFSAQMLMRACPDAERICFGDAWGLVYSNAYFESITYPCDVGLVLKAPATWLRNLLVRYRRRRVLGPRYRRLDARFAVLILPNDPGFDFLPGKTQLRVARETVEQVIEALGKVVSGRDVSLSRQPDAILLVGSFAESRFCDEANELELYADVLAEFLPLDSALLIKGHSAATRHKILKIAEQSARNNRVELLPEILTEFPIEVLAGIWPKARIISFAYASVSLTYLKREGVLHAMHDLMIDRHFPPSSHVWMKSSNDLYLSEMEVARLT